MDNQSVWFWQRIVSPHMAFLADALAAQGWSVVYVANQQMSADRASQGWQPPELKQAQVKIAPDAHSVEALIASSPRDSIHICQGIRRNGLVGVAQHCLARRGLKQWVVMETVDDAAWWGFFKRLLYRYHFWRRRHHLSGVLATGENTCAWVVSCGVDEKKAFPFAYFLETTKIFEPKPDKKEKKFRFIFVGQLIDRKRVDLLIAAVAALDSTEIELVIIGSGPSELGLRRRSERQLPGRIEWKGSLPMHLVPSVIAASDCLILPSRHDGWGAAVSEALMVGTPVICSDACGAAVAVKASGVGGVFPANNQQALTDALRKRYEESFSRFDQRQQLAEWAKCLGAEAGAIYLSSILQRKETNDGKPLPPWERTPKADLMSADV